MSLHYVDSSAWAKTIIAEDESAALHDWATAELASGATLVSSHLLITELHRMAQRCGLEAAAVTESVAVLNLTVPAAPTYRSAGLLPGAVRSLDALHVASALEVGADTFITYDERQADAARASGIKVVSPE